MVVRSSTIGEDRLQDVPYIFIGSLVTSRGGQIIIVGLIDPRSCTTGGTTMYRCRTCLSATSSDLE